MVAALTREAPTERVQLWLSRRDPPALLISDRVVTEFASAMSIKLRVNQLRIEDRARAKGLFNKLKAESLTVTAVTASHFVTAARFAEHYATGLRAGDALHVAIAAEVGAKICTLDKGLAEGATTLGVSVELV